ncbi:TPA: hypothetical protein SMM93_001133 [Proteus mirabilis]
MRHLNIESDKFFARIPNRFYFYEKYVLDLYHKRYCAVPKNIDNDIIYYIVSDIEKELRLVIEVVKQTILILSNYENIDAQLIRKIETVESTINSISKNIGDKMATENQNDHE